MLKQELIKYIDSLVNNKEKCKSMYENAKKNGNLYSQAVHESEVEMYGFIINDLRGILKECEKIENIRHVTINSLYGKTPDFKPGDFTPICDQPFICLKGMRGSGKRYTLFEENLKRLIREVIMENGQNDK